MSGWALLTLPISPARRWGGWGEGGVQEKRLGTRNVGKQLTNVGRQLTKGMWAGD
jgi:hypothetical protein